LANSIAHVGAKLQPHKSEVLHSLLLPDHKATIQYCRWLQKLRFNGLLNPELMFYSDGVWFTLNGYTKSQITDIKAEKILILFIKHHCMI
jgi:hypothetical protein